MLMLFTFWYVFGMADTGCFFLCVMLLSEALVSKPGGDEISEYLLVRKKIYFFFTYEA